MFGSEGFRRADTDEQRGYQRGCADAISCFRSGRNPLQIIQKPASDSEIDDAFRAGFAKATEG